MYSSFYGEEIDNIKQLVNYSCGSDELKDFIIHCVEFRNNAVLDGVIKTDESEQKICFECLSSKSCDCGYW
jgi:hypothetical protein